ncbi:hypothetical protein CBD41_04445 [bacterium TMED181]|nr:hydrolase TatD [Planctomycetota bacterium]OUW45063.1 MAG: hypothetical protein CBD41_04445 [bacterium TMED181]
MNIPAIDSHAHLYFDRFDEDREEVIQRARESGFVGIINIGIDIETSQRVVELAVEYPHFCHAAVGLHPTHCLLDEPEYQKTLSDLENLCLNHPQQVVAIGEIGLDYYWKDVPPEIQERAFRDQLDLARKVDRPVVIHCRDAWPDTLDVIADAGDGIVGVFHCFGGTPKEAERALDLGWYISFAGNVTYPKAEALREAALVVPDNRLLLETDSPFLAPQQVRGKRNEPAYALHTAETLAKVRKQGLRELLENTTANSRRLFRLKTGEPGSEEN